MDTQHPSQRSASFMFKCRRVRPVLAARQAYCCSFRGEMKHKATMSDLLPLGGSSVTRQDRIGWTNHFLCSHHCAIGKAPALRTDRNKIFTCFNKYLVLSLKLVNCFPCGASRKIIVRALIGFSGLCNLEDFILHKTIFFIYLKLVLSYI